MREHANSKFPDFRLRNLTGFRVTSIGVYFKVAQLNNQVRQEFGFLIAISITQRTTLQIFSE